MWFQSTPRCLAGPEGQCGKTPMCAHPPGSECWQRCFPFGVRTVLGAGLLRDDAFMQEALRLDLDASLLQRGRTARAPEL